MPLSVIVMTSHPSYGSSPSVGAAIGAAHVVCQSFPDVDPRRVISARLLTIGRNMLVVVAVSPSTAMSSHWTTRRRRTNEEMKSRILVVRNGFSVLLRWLIDGA